MVVVVLALAGVGVALVDLAADPRQLACRGGRTPMSQCGGIIRRGDARTTIRQCDGAIRVVSAARPRCRRTAVVVVREDGHAVDADARRARRGQAGHARERV